MSGRVATHRPEPRSRAMDGLFLVSTAGGVAIYWILHVQAGIRAVLSPWLFAVATVVMVVAWFRVSWERDAGGPAKLLSLGFALLALVATLDSIGSGVVCGLSVANLVFTWSKRVAAVHVVVITTAFVLTVAVPDGLDAYEITLLMFGMLITIAILVLADVVRRSRDDKRLTESLYARLESAHDELSDRAERIRELTVGAERARFARDMHDSIGHYLTVIALTLRTAERLGPDYAERAWAEITQARELTSAALEETRRTVRALRPVPLGQGDLGEVLRSLVGSLRSSALDLQFTANEYDVHVDDRVADVLYRSAQEGISNIVRHSRASHAQVRLQVGTDVELAVLDGGPPRDEDGTSGSGGSGLAGLRDRATEVGGVVQAGPCGGGFALRVRIPLEASSDPHEPMGPHKRVADQTGPARSRPT